MDENAFITYLVLVPFLGVTAQWLAWRLQVPSILMLLGLGLVLGIWIRPDTLLADLTGGDETIGPKLLFPIVSLSVAVILFEGGLTLRWRAIRDSGGVVIRLILIASAISMLLTSLLTHWLLGFSWQVSCLLGAILIVTGPTVVGPLLRQIRPTRRVGSVLQWEGILIDPIGAVAAVLVFEVIANAAEQTWMQLSLIVGMTLLFGSAIGILGAALSVIVLRNYWLPDYLHGVFFLVVALVAYLISNYLREESGLVAVTVLGITLANQKQVSLEHVLEFKEDLRVFLISCLFIVLGSRLRVAELVEIGWGAVPMLLSIILVVRPVSVFIATYGTKLSWRERLFIGLVAPRGIVAASVASVFGLRLLTLGSQNEAFESFAEEARLLAPATFLVILGTVTFCGLAAAPLARFLGLSDPNPQGILLAGGSRVARQLGKVLQKLEVPILLVDTNYGNVTAAKMEGLPAQAANIMSEHVKESLELSGIGRLFALTSNDEVNTLAVQEYMPIFGRASVYQLPSRKKNTGRWQSIPEHRRGRSLFREDLHFSEFESILASGGVIKATPITDSFSFEQFQQRHGDKAVVLMAMAADGKLRVRSVPQTLSVSAGETVIALLLPDEKFGPPVEEKKAVS